MSTLTTLSVFYFGTTVTTDNNKISFNEGGPELVATLNIGDYSLTEYADEVERALNAAGALTYTVALNRTTRKLTISATGTFALLALTGSFSGTSAFPTMGFATTSDKTGASSYVGENGAGSEYRPQYILENYTAIKDFKVKESSVVNVSVAGVVQTIQFGDGARMRANIVVITDKVNLKLDPFFSNASGVQAARDFMDYAITKAKMEFMPNVADRNTFDTIILESTKADKDGTAYELTNMSKAKDFYQTGELLFRKAIA